MKSCLIVDDSRVVRKVIRRIAEDLGFECSEAEDGEQAYTVCQKFIPQVILLDWNLPNKDGLTFLKELRQMPNGKKPKVIFCTIENTTGQIKKAIDNGADEYIMKPFDSEIIETKFIQVGLLG